MSPSGLAYGKDEWLPALLLIGAAMLAGAWLNTANLDYSIGHHWDALKKVQFIRGKVPDFNHPILMLQIVKFADLFVQSADVKETMLLARRVMAVAGVFNIIAVFLLARQFVRPLVAAACALLAGLVPMNVVHAHYVKEDMIFTLFATLALAAYFHLVSRPGGARLILFAIVAGLAASAKYPAVLLFALPLLGARPRGDKSALKSRVICFGLALAAGGAVFLLVNYPLVANFGTFISGLSHESRHVLEGHRVRLWPLDYLWTFHLRFSLLPGLTIWVLVPVLLVTGFVFVTRKKQTLEVKTLLWVVILFYLIIESVPLKPFPDYMRYAQPLVGPLIILFAVGLVQLSSKVLPGRFSAGVVQSALVSVVFLLISVPAYLSSAAYAEAFANDTRDVTESLLSKIQGRVVAEVYTVPCVLECASLMNLAPVFDAVAFFLPDRPDMIASADFAVISGFQYERMFLSEKLVWHPASHQKLADFYRDLLKRPRLHIAARLPRFGFMNPDVDIIDLKKNGEQLKRIQGINSNKQITTRFIPAQAVRGSGPVPNPVKTDNL